MLDVGNHDGRRVKVELLNRIIGAKSEQRGTWAVDSKTADMLKSRD